MQIKAFLMLFQCSYYDVVTVGNLKFFEILQCIHSVFDV
jgi:hypothetical protein